MNSKLVSKYLVIAGYTIKVDLFDTEYDVIKNNFNQMIESSFNGFIKSHSDNKKIDFTIAVKPTETFMFFNRSKNAYVKLYSRTTNPKKIVTHYSISNHQFQLILMQILFWLLGKNGYIIHCSALHIDRGAILFLGKQGAGKSTAAALLSNTYSVLADDNGIIRREKRGYFFYQSPSMEKIDSIKKTSVGLPLKMLFFLRKSSIYKVAKITDKKELFKKMFNQFLGDLNDSKDKVDFLFDMLNIFNSFYLLSFGKDKQKLKKLVLGTPTTVKPVSL